MTYQVVIKAEAQADVVAAYNYYEGKQASLGEEFLAAFENRCLDLSQHPTHYGYIIEDPKGVLRDVKLNRFPTYLFLKLPPPK